MTVKLREEYARWQRCATWDEDVVRELKTMDGGQIEDAFYRDLAFGTGGLRGTVGAGTNRMNVHTVAKATQGLSDYLRGHSDAPSVVIGHDSRIKSDVFARVAAAVFAANGIRVHLWPRLLPVPTVSFATRYLGADAGVMITASHNPAAYNGYKVYGSDGCQITSQAAKQILAQIRKLDIFEDVPKPDFSGELARGAISYIAEEVHDAYLRAVREQSVLFGDPVRRDAAIVYTPLNGAGQESVLRTLASCGYENVTVVKEQEQPDGNFPTCPYPNPEIREAMALGVEYARRHSADLLLATDPDCDRVGIAVKDSRGEYVLLSGNETGLLLLDYVCSQRRRHGKMPANPVLVKTVVTTDLAERIAEHYGVRTVNVLTGFKYIGEQIGLLERQGRADDYIFGFEESYGYLSGGYVRDKDGVNAALLICEMFGFYAEQGISLPEKLQELYRQYGYCLNTLHTYTFEGSAGFDSMQRIMASLRQGVQTLGGSKVLDCLDYAKGLDGLPASDVLKFRLEDNCSVVIRPSGTEPKLKAYICVGAEDEPAAREREAELASWLEGQLR